MKKIFICLLLYSFNILFSLNPIVETRVKDISRLLNDRQNVLIGYGLVVGLQGTGDNHSNSATQQALGNMLNNFGAHNIDLKNIKPKNSAVVMVTARLGAFNLPGDSIDVHVSSIGQADSLRGGVLLFTPLKAANGEVYALAQGPVAVGGYSVSGGRTKKSQNHVASAIIPNGAIVERSVNAKLDIDGELIWVLDKSDFNTVNNVRNAIAQLNNNWQVSARSGSQISLKVPDEYIGREVELIAMIDSLSVDSDMLAKIVVNERTGAVVMGGPVKIAPVVVSHQNLNISVKSDPLVSQPAPFAAGETTVVEDTRIAVEESNTRMPLEVVNTAENTIEQVVAVLNNIGMTPSDIITILQLMKEAGAIKGKLEVI
jgi:flagellar P-ring protein FlgI